MTHHDERLVEYCLGLLSSEERARIEGELAGSAALRAACAEIEATLGAVGDAAEPQQPGDRVREALLRSVDPASPLDGFVGRLSSFLDLDEAATRELLAAVPAAPGGRFEPGSRSGVHVVHFDGGARVAEASCGLVWCEPALVYPRHRHLGDEWAFVLEGRAEETGGALWAPGDVVHKPAGSDHGFRVLDDQPYVAVVVHRGLELVEG